MNSTEHRTRIVYDILERQMPDTLRPDTCREAVKESVHILMESLLCDLKFDRYLFNELLMVYGWTPDDVEYFGIGDLFTE